MFAIGEAVCIGDRPTTRRDGLGTTRADSLCAACIPDVEENERLSGNMQRPELLGFPRLIGHCHRAACRAPCQCARNSLLNSSQRSSGKKILAPFNSTRRRVPGMFSANQCDHFTSKYTSSVPQTISVGAFSVFSRASMASVCLLSKAARKRCRSRVRCSPLTSGRRYFSMVPWLSWSGGSYGGPRACGDQ